MTDENDAGTDDTGHEEDLSSAPVDEPTDDDPATPEAAFEKLIRPEGDTEQADAPTELEELKFIGPATGEALEASDIDVEAIVEGTVSFRDLVNAGVNAGVAAKIRRWHSLSWSFSSGDDLDRRSTQVRGLDDEERQWIAASSSGWDKEEPQSGDWTPTGATTSDSGEATSARDGDWTPTGSGDWTPTGANDDSDSPRTSGDWTPTKKGTTADGSGDALAAEAAWRERSKPTPLTELDGIGEEEAELLSEAGVRSVRRLATADPEHVSDALLIDEERVDEWKQQARNMMD